MLHLLTTLLLVLAHGAQVIAADETPRDFSEMPVMVLYCDEDPGRINVGGGKDPSPETLIASGICTPAEGVALTFVLVNDDWDFETDDPEEDWDVNSKSWFARCDMDAEGTCALDSPQGFDIVLGVFLHENTVKPGYEPAFFQPTTHNFTEFAGYGLALIPVDGTASPEATTADHQTLALSIQRTGESANVLTEWDFEDDDEGDTYLATNTDGWVSNVIQADDRVEIDLVNVPDSANITVGCSVNDDSTIPVEAVVDDGDITIRVPDTDSDIRCDIVIS